MLKEFIQNKIRDFVMKEYKEVGQNLQAEISYRFKMYRRKIIKDFCSMLILLAALLFLVLTAVFFMIEYLALSKTITCGIVGILLLIMGIIVKIVE